MRALSLCFALSFAAIGCGSGSPAANEPPQLLSVEVPAKAASKVDYYEVTGWLSAFDPDGMIRSVQVRIPADGSWYNFDIGEHARVDQFPLVVRFQSDVAQSGSAVFETAVKDDEGALSNWISRTATLQ
jgi:hypothetical protein